nr:hypothetical protein RVX_1482 [Nitratidesulfovibrio sp. HK-II]
MKIFLPSPRPPSFLQIFYLSGEWVRGTGSLTSGLSPLIGNVLGKRGRGFGGRGEDPFGKGSSPLPPFALRCLYP